MEKSVKHYPGREQIIPVLLLVAGLICASWLSVDSGNKNDVAVNLMAETNIVSDTVKKKEKSARYSRKKIITTGEDRKPHEEIVEEFEGDEELRPLLAQPDLDNFDLDLDLNFEPPVTNFRFPDVELMLGPLAVLGDFNIPGLNGPNITLDTIPNIRWKHSQDWEEFSEQFEKKFREKFGDFYESNQKDFEKMMEELESQFENRSEEFQEAWAGKWNEEAKRSMEIAKRQMEEIEKFQQSKAWAEQEKAMRLVEEKMKEQQFHFREMEEKMKLWEEKMQVFEQELKEQLVLDGYIDENEKIRNMSWDDDGDIEINGQKIKEKDKQKYKDLHKKYFKGSGNFRYVE